MKTIQFEGEAYEYDELAPRRWSVQKALALGETDPIVDNNSVESRKTNRRLEIFLIPEQTMLQQAKKGRINMSQMGKK